MNESKLNLPEPTIVVTFPQSAITMVGYSVNQVETMIDNLRAEYEDQIKELKDKISDLEFDLECYQEVAKES